MKGFVIICFFFAAVALASLESKLQEALHAHEQDFNVTGRLPLAVNETVAHLEVILERNVRVLGKRCTSPCDLDSCLNIWYPGNEALVNWFRNAVSSPEKTKAASTVLFTFYDQVYEAWFETHARDVFPIFRNQTHWQMCWK